MPIIEQVAISAARSALYKGSSVAGQYLGKKGSSAAIKFLEGMSARNFKKDFTNLLPKVGTDIWEDVSPVTTFAKKAIAGGGPLLASAAITGLTDVGLSYLTGVNNSVQSSNEIKQLQKEVNKMNKKISELEKDNKNLEKSIKLKR